MDSRREEQIKGFARQLKEFLEDKRASKNLAPPGVSFYVVEGFVGHDPERTAEFMTLVVNILGLSHASLGCREHVAENVRATFLANLPSEIILGFLADDALFSDDLEIVRRNERLFLEDDLKWLFLQCAGLTGLRIPESQEEEMSLMEAHTALMSQTAGEWPARDALERSLSWIWPSWEGKFLRARMYLGWVASYQEQWEQPPLSDEVSTTLRKLAEYASQ